MADCGAPVASPMKKSWPVPERLTLWGPAGALSLIAIKPVSGPPVAGVKLTLMTQLAPAATLAPQLFVSVKFVVVDEIPVMFSTALPVFVSVTV